MRYDRNETMRVIGSQDVGRALTSEVRRELADVREAHDLVSDLDVYTIDVFLLGYAHGTKNERQNAKYADYVRMFIKGYDFSRS